jgi:hypothetical protein
MPLLLVIVIVMLMVVRGAGYWFVGVMQQHMQQVMAVPGVPGAAE